MAIEKIKVTDTSVIEQIRNSLPTANINKNGLMDFKDKKRGFCWESQAEKGKLFLWVNSQEPRAFHFLLLVVIIAVLLHQILLH